MKITKKDVEHVAKLARLGLTEEEKEKFTVQLSNIIEYAETINKLDTSNIEPTSHSIPMSNIFREDKMKQFEDIESIMNNAPDKEDNMFRVPRILE